MKKSIALITDSASDLPPELADELGIRVVPGSFAFADERAADEPSAAPLVYARMRESGHAPRTFGPTEAAWATAFREGLEEARSVACLVTPFDIASSFTTASAAMLAIQYEEPESHIKIVNPGVGSVGLASLLGSLAYTCEDRCEMDELLETIESLEPACNSLFVPATLEWLHRSGRLALVEERLGDLEGAYPVLRVGTRLTGVGRAASHEECLELAVGMVAGRTDSGAPLTITIAHADSGDTAQRAAKMVCAAYPDSVIGVTNLTATIGAQLGPGAIGIGAAPRGAAKEN